MRSANDLIGEAIALPVEDRARVVETILRSLNPAEPTIERAWTQEAARRLADIRSGRVDAVDGAEVMLRMRDRLPK
jgi:putative addiction module component (TIGR02574 family)